MKSEQNDNIKNLSANLIKLQQEFDQFKKAQTQQLDIFSPAANSQHPPRTVLVVKSVRELIL